MSKHLSKLRGSLGIWMITLVLFGMSAGFFFLAYAGMESGTAMKTTANPFRGNRAPRVFIGVYFREKDPARFWVNETCFLAGGIIFTLCGVRVLREEYQRRQQQGHNQAEGLNHSSRGQHPR